MAPPRQRMPLAGTVDAERPEKIIPSQSTDNVGVLEDVGRVVPTDELELEHLSINSEPLDNDKIIEEHGIKIFVDKKSYVFLAGTVLDFSDGLNGKGVTFHNPNAKSTCGCGVSFSA